MVHQGQGLPLGFEAGEDLFGIHAQLDDFQRHPAADRLLLLSHIDYATAAFANLLEQFVAANPVPRLFGGLDDRSFPSGVNGQAVHKRSG